MHAKYYLSQEIFEREQSKIFRKLWLFAGLKTLLQKNNAFLTRTICGIPIVIQNLHGEIRAFENVCLHRNALIQFGDVGCRPLACPYHGWLYGEHGEVKNIPGCDAIYRINDCERQRLKLREFPLQLIGNLIFISLNEQPFPIEEQFGPEFVESLRSSASCYDGEVMVTTLHGRFNWKLAYENLRDFNHVPFVHRNSLARSVTFEGGIDGGMLTESQEPLVDKGPTGMRAEMRRFSYGGPEGVRTDLRHVPFHDIVERWGEEGAYYNWLPFPNVHIASGDGGYSFTLEHHIPIAPDRTDLEIYRFTTRKLKSYAFSSWNLLAKMHGSRVVVGEDIAIMERVQAALHEHAPVPTQGAYEYMNRLVERWYTTLMGPDHEI